MKRFRSRLTFANVIACIALFVALGGASYAATQLPKNSVGTKQLKGNAVTTAKIKKNAIATAKIKKNAVTTAKLKDGAVTGAKVNLGTLGTVPSSATTEEIRSTKGTLSLGQQATFFEYGGVKLSISCETWEVTKITARAYIESATDGTAFLSWEDGSKAIGPATPLTEREITHPNWADSNGPLGYEAGAPVDVTTAAGASFMGTLGLASEKASNTCWYWFNATILG
jgi:hypothetical protein